ncbi:glycosyltransferase family 2 protein [Dechloromonas sp. A34]|uniref:glycosyltransferase family 2 protein n=1 Tax=Dechloromonas sp. A34 TaxID=447588 RepID=UPI0022490207|nr:glycosyltransferase family 2 protein [Dechloromonas sp. A34]
MPTTWSIAVFAHNEAANIAATLESIRVVEDGITIRVVVLANGCIDSTASIVRELARLHHNLQVVEIPLADKANAWNLYIHEISANPSLSLAEMHVFIDGDVQVVPGSLAALAAAFEQAPTANAAGGLPVTGRDHEAWSRRMLANGTLAGGLYALRGSFVERIRQRGIRIPQGLIGEDWLVSLLAKSDLQPLAGNHYAVLRIVFPSAAGFSFRSLEPWHLKDWIIYLRRLWRYALRGVQFEMLFGWLMYKPPDALPPNVEQVYRLALPPSRLKWIGRTSPLRFLAIQRIRSLRTRKPPN